MRAILILVAVEFEARVLARELELPARDRRTWSAIGSRSVRLAALGPGAPSLEARWPSLIAGLAQPLVISAGLCGGLDPALGAGGLVVPESVIGPSGAALRVAVADHRWAMAADPSAATGAIVTTREVVATTDAKARLRARTDAVAADMESSFILEAAAAAGLPALVVRGVSDRASQCLPPELVALVAPDGRLRLRRAAALLARPAILPQALTLRRTSRRALRRVASVLAALAA